MKSREYVFDARKGCLTVVLAALVLLLSGCTPVMSNEVSPVAGDNVKQEATGLDMKQKERGNKAGSALLPGITVSFRLDRWLVSGVYGSGFWVSRPVLGPVSQPGNTFTVEARAAGVDAHGHIVNINPEWIPEDPDLVSVSPTVGTQVRITVKGAGQSTLKVATRDFSKELSIRATKDDGKPIQVEISQ